MFKRLLIFLLFASTCSGAVPNWHFKDSTPAYWRNDAGVWKMQTGVTPAWVDTNSADLIMMVYGQDAQPERVIYDVFGGSDNVIMNASGTEPPNVSGGKAYFWSNPYLVNTNVQHVLGASFSNITTLAWAELDAGAAGGLVGIDDLDGSQPRYGMVIDGFTLETRLNDTYPGLKVGAATTNMMLYMSIFDGLNIINSTNGIDAGTTAFSAILDATGQDQVVGDYRGGRPIESRISAIANWGRTVTSNERATINAAGWDSLASDTISTNALLSMIVFTNDVTRWADMSGNWANPYPSANYGNTLTRVIVGTNANGVVQYGWDCDGVDDMAEFTMNRSPVGSALTMGTNDFLQSCWVYLRVNNQDDVIAGITPFNSNGYGLTLENVNSKWEFSIATSGTNFVADSDSVATMSNWVHVAGWRNAGTMTLYLDGVAQTNTANIGANNIALTTGSPFTIGGGNGTVIDGILCDPARIYISDNITEAFIGELYTNTGPTSIETRIDNR